MEIPTLRPMINTPFKTSLSGAVADQENGAEPKDWTVLMYIAGDNDLEPYAARMMLDLEDKCGSSESMNVVAQLGRMDQAALKKLYESQGREYEPTGVDGDWGGIRRYHVTQNSGRGEEEKDTILSQCLGQTEDKQMSDATTLADFLVYGMKKYPAKHYMVVLADHGGGWLGAFTSDASASGSSIMKPAAISSAFRIAETATGQKPEVVDMVACLMATSEMAYQMKDRAKYLLASEEIGTTASFDYGPIIHEIGEASQSGTPLDAEAVARKVVHAYDHNPEAFKTKSAVDLPQMHAVADKVKTLVERLRATQTDPEAIAAAIRGSQHFGMTDDGIYPFYDQIHDLKGMAQQLIDSGDIEDAELKSAAEAVRDSVGQSVLDNLAHDYQRIEVIGKGRTLDGKETFTEYRVFEGHYDSHGLSIFAPLDGRYLKGPKMQEYQELDFSKQTGWADYVQELNRKLVEKKESDGAVVARPVDPNRLRLHDAFSGELTRAVLGDAPRVDGLTPVEPHLEPVDPDTAGGLAPLRASRSPGWQTGALRRPSSRPG